MKTKQMSYGLTWLFLTLLMIGMSWSAAVSPTDETVLSSSDDDTSSTEVDIVALDAIETNTNNLIFEEEASEDDLVKPLEGLRDESRPTPNSLEYYEEYNPDYAEFLAEGIHQDNQLDLLNAANLDDETVFSNTEEDAVAFTEENPTGEETTSGRAACTGSTTIGAHYYEDFEHGGGTYNRGYLQNTDFTNQGNGIYGNGKRWRKATYSPSSGTGPTSAHGGNYFVHTEGSPYDSQVSILVHDTCIDTTSLGSMNVDFWYHQWGATSGSSYQCDWLGNCQWVSIPGMKWFRFQVSDDQGASWDTIWGKYNNQGNSWKHTGIINMDSYVGLSDLAIRFTAQMYSQSWYDDYSMDDFHFSGVLSGADADGDGVMDDNDDCDGIPASEPTHPPNIDVGSDGCPFDDDDDGIWNINDECPFTPLSLAGTVDLAGCPAGFAIPWSENFEGHGDIISANTDGWFSVDETSANGGNDWLWYSSSWNCVGDNSQGSHCMAQNYDYETGDRWLVSPRVQIPAAVAFGVELTFDEYIAFPDWYQGSWGSPSNVHQLWISEKACDPLMGDYQMLWEATQAEVVANANGGTTSYDLSLFAGKSVCLSWVYNQYDGTSWYVDDIAIDLKTSPDDNDNDGVWDADEFGNQIDLCPNSAAGAAVTPLDLEDLNSDGALNYADYDSSVAQSATLGCQQSIPLPYAQTFDTWMAGGGDYDGPAGFYNYNIGPGFTWKRTTVAPSGDSPAAYRPYSSSANGVVESHFVTPMLDLTKAVDGVDANGDDIIVTPDIAYMEWEERGTFVSYYSMQYSGYNGIRVAEVDRSVNPLQECDPSDAGLTWSYIDNDDAGDTNGDGTIDSKDNKLLGRHDGETGYPRSPSNTGGYSWQDNRVELTPYLGKEICIDFFYEGMYAHDWYIDNIDINYDVIAPDTTAPYIADHWQTTTLEYEFKGFVPYQGNTYRGDARTMMIVLSDDASGVDNGLGLSSSAQAPTLNFQMTHPLAVSTENPTGIVFPTPAIMAAQTAAGSTTPTFYGDSVVPAFANTAVDASAGYSECAQDVPIPFTQTHTCLFYASLPELTNPGTTMHYFWKWQDIGWKGDNGLTHPITGTLLDDLGGGPNVATTPTYSYTLTTPDYAADDAMKMQMLVEKVNSAADTPADAGTLTSLMSGGAADYPQYYDVQMTYFGDTKETLWEYDMSGCIPVDMAQIGFPGQMAYPGCIDGPITRILLGQNPVGAQALLGAVYHPSADMYMFDTKPDNAAFPVFVPGTVTNWIQYYDAGMDAMGVVSLGSPLVDAGTPGSNIGISESPSEFATTYSAFDLVSASKPGDGYLMMDVPTGITEHLVGEYGLNTFEANSDDTSVFNQMCVTSNSIFAYMDTYRETDLNNDGAEDGLIQSIEYSASSPCRSMAALGDFGFNGFGWAVAEGHFAYTEDQSYSSADNLWEISLEVNHIIPQVITEIAPGVSTVQRGDGVSLTNWDAGEQWNLIMTEDTPDGHGELTYDLRQMRPNNDGLWWDIARGTDAGACNSNDFFQSALFGTGDDSDDLTFSLIADATTNAPQGPSPPSQIDWMNNNGEHQIWEQADGGCNMDLMLREGPVRVHETISIRLQVSNEVEEMPDYHFDLTQPEPFTFSNVMNVLPNTVVPVEIFVTNSGDDPALYDYDHELVVQFYTNDVVGEDCTGMLSSYVTDVTTYECGYSTRTIKNPPGVGETVHVSSEIMLGANTQTVRAHVDVMTCSDNPCMDGAIAVPPALDHTGAETAQAVYITSDGGPSDVSENPRNMNLEDKDWSNNMADSTAAGSELPNRVGLNVANSVPSFAPSLVAVGIVGLFVGVLINSSRREEDEEVLMEEDEMAVSPVIATILMVAITVVLSGIIYVWASQLANTSAKGTPMFTFNADHFDEGYWQITVQDSSDMELATQAVWVQVEWTVTAGPDAGDYVFYKTSLANNSGGYGFAPSNSGEFVTFLDSIDCSQDCTTMYGTDDNIRISTTDPDGHAIDSAIVTVSYEISSENYILRTFTAVGGTSPNIS